MKPEQRIRKMRLADNQRDMTRRRDVKLRQYSRRVAVKVKVQQWTRIHDA